MGAPSTTPQQIGFFEGRMHNDDFHATLLATRGGRSLSPMSPLSSFNSPEAIAIAHMRSPARS